MIAAWVMLIASIAGVVARQVAVTNHLELVAAVTSPFLALVAPLSAVAFLVLRRWIAAGLGVVVTIAAVAAQLPLFLRETPAEGVPVRTMSAILYFGLGDPRALVAEAIARADVLAVQELTLDEVGRLRAAGLEQHFPYHALDARPFASGVGIWSRFPIVESHRVPGYELAMVSTRLAIKDVRVNPTVLVAHLSGPWPQPIDDWRTDITRMPSTMRAAAAGAAGGCVIVAGDFNSTLDMKPFRRLLDEGYRDAAEQSGAGWKFTYPGNSHIPPFMGIDHILTSACPATSADTIVLPKSDHRGLLATVSVPRSPVSAS